MVEQTTSTTQRKPRDGRLGTPRPVLRRSSVGAELVRCERGACACFQVANSFKQKAECGVHEQPPKCCRRLPRQLVCHQSESCLWLVYPSPVAAEEFLFIQNTLATPDQAALHHGIARTDVVARLQDLQDALVFESNRADDENEIPGPCMEMLLEGDILGQLVRLTANDRLAGSQAEVVRLFASLIILLEEKFLSRQAVHKPLVRLMRICVGDEFYTPASHIAEEPEDSNEDEERKAWRRFGRNGSAEVLGFEEDLVDMMCHVASRLRNTPELLIIFFRERKRDAEARKAFDAAVSGSSAGSTRASSPAGPSTPTGATPKGSSLNIPTPASSSNGSGGGRQLAYDFPLFSYLLRFVHRESRTGELARAGLLFLVDVALAPGRKNLGRGKGGQQQQQHQSLAISPSRRMPPRGRGSYRGRGGAAARGTGRIEVNLGPGPSVALARFMLESDFAEVLAAGLGAVYGLLPGKLALVKAHQTSNDRADAHQNVQRSSGLVASGSMLLESEETDVLASTDAQLEKLAQHGIEASTSTEVRRQARLVADILEFTQDILRTSDRVHRQQSHADGGKDPRLAVELTNIARDLTKSIGRALQTLFLRNILYPSLLECSDTDGSAVAVMSYLDTILSVIEDDSPLADFVIGWLVGLDEGMVAEKKPGVAEEILEPKRKSTAMLQIEREAAGIGQGRAAYFSDALGRYGLRDVVKDHLTPSTSAASKTAALRLANTLSTFHGRFVPSFFIDVISDGLATSFPSGIVAAKLFKETSESERHRFSQNTGKEGTEQESESEDDFTYPGSKKDEDVRHESLAHLPHLASANISVAQHALEMDLYLSLVLAIERGSSSQEASFSSTGFENYLSDAEQDLARDSTFIDGLRELEDLSHPLLSEEESNDQASVVINGIFTNTPTKTQGQVMELQAFKHKISAQDQLMRTLMATLARFFEHPPGVNVALASMISSLALCPYRSLEGFLIFASTSSNGTTEVMQEAADMFKPRTAFDSDDDRSDDEIEHTSHRPTSSWPVEKPDVHTASALKGSRSSRKKQAAPIVLALLRSLAKQVEEHRNEIQDFDRLLEERRRGLLYVENLNDALNAAGLDRLLQEGEEKENGFDGKLKPSLVVPSHEKSMDRLWESVGIDDPVMAESKSQKLRGSRQSRIQLPPPPSATPSQGFESQAQMDDNEGEDGTAAERKSRDGSKPKKGRNSGFSRFFGRPARKEDSSKVDAADSSAVARDEETKPSTMASESVLPFVEHYRHTRSILVEPRVIRISRKSPWSLKYREREKTTLMKAQSVADKKIKRTRFRSHVGSDEDDEEDAEDEEFKYPGADDDDSDDEDDARRRGAGEQTRMVTLSSLLDNIVVLEETIKQLAAIIQVRRAWGIDSIQFV